MYGTLQKVFHTFFRYQVCDKIQRTFSKLPGMQLVIN